MPHIQHNQLYKYSGVLWRVCTNESGLSWIMDPPVCPTEGCRSELLQERGIYICEFCKKEHPCPDGYQKTLESADRKWNGYRLKEATIYSLDLPPTKVISEAEDENYWVQARISEKGGKRMAVVYFGQRIKGEQDKKDYSQIFIDFDDEQLRFDKTNKNPMKLLAKLEAEFPDSITTLTKNLLKTSQ